MALFTVTAVAATPPNVTEAPFWNAVPVIVTTVPPVAGPALGETEDTAGGATKVKVPGVPALCPSEFVTCTETVPAACAGVTAVICVDETTTTLLAAEPPTETVAPVRKFVPVMVILVPPAATPDVGDTLEIVGAGAW